MRVILRYPGNKPDLDDSLYHQGRERDQATAEGTRHTVGRHGRLIKSAPLS